MGSDTFDGMPVSQGPTGPVEGLTPGKFFRVGYQDDPRVPNGKAIATALWAVIDDVFVQCSGFFRGLDLGANPRFPLPITFIVWNPDLDPATTGATWTALVGIVPRIQTSINVFDSSTTNDNDRLLYLAMLELSEMFMAAQNTGWYAGILHIDVAGFGFTEGNIGEGLSHYTAAEYAKLKHLNFVDDFSNVWMVQDRIPATATEPEVPRRDISHIGSSVETTDEGPQSACALLFIYYLHAQLGFDTQTIIASGDTNPADDNVPAKLSLADVYRNLTGDTSGTDPAVLFALLLNTRFPFPTQIPFDLTAIPQNPNNPWPFVLMDFSPGQQSIFQAIDTFNRQGDQPGTFTASAVVVVKGLSLFMANFLQITITCQEIPGLFISRMSGRQPMPADSNTRVPQTLTLSFDLDFPNLALFGAVGSTRSATLVATADFAPNTPFLSPPGPSHSTTATKSILLDGSDVNPFFQNVTGTSPPTLSRDLVILTATPRHDASPCKPGFNHAPANSAPIFHTDPSTVNTEEADDTPFAWQYLADLLAWLNKYFAAGGSGFPDPFTSGEVPSNMDSPASLTPYTTWYENVNFQKRGRNYHFAIARVQLKGDFDTVAPRTQVFFRHFGPGTGAVPPFTELPGRGYETDRNGGHPPFPLASSTNLFPLFGTNVTKTQLLGVNGINPEFGPGGLNSADLTQAGPTSTVWRYYGCFIDPWVAAQNPPEGQSTWSLLAQIEFAPVPVMAGEVPSNSLKLAQRDVVYTTP